MLVLCVVGLVLLATTTNAGKSFNFISLQVYQLELNLLLILYILMIKLELKGFIAILQLY